MRNKQLCMVYILYENKTEATTQNINLKKEKEVKIHIKIKLEVKRWKKEGNFFSTKWEKCY